MSSIAFIFDTIFSFIITLIFLYRCGNYRRQHPITTIAVFIAWFFSVLIVFILPLDISLVNQFISLNFFIIYFIFQAVYRDCQLNPPSAPIKPIIDNSTKVKILFNATQKKRRKVFVG